MKISIVSGGFDPIHSGHIDYLKHAASFADKLIVLLNSDEWLVNKKGKFFMPFNERKIILENLSFVSEVMNFKDDELGSCTDGINKVKEKYPEHSIIFCNGGDRDIGNIPEASLKGIKLEFGVGGNYKKNSSSSILKEWKTDTTNRLWGDYQILFEADQLKVKELIVNPRSGMSYQKHFLRSEFWFVYEGSCKILYNETDDQAKNKIFTLKKNDYYFVKRGAWHQITNPTNSICRIIEIQYGLKVIEEDIERSHYYNKKI